MTSDLLSDLAAQIPELLLKTEAADLEFYGRDWRNIDHGEVIQRQAALGDHRPLSLKKSGR